MMNEEERLRPVFLSSDENEKTKIFGPRHKVASDITYCTAKCTSLTVDGYYFCLLQVLLLDK